MTMSLGNFKVTNSKGKAIGKVELKYINGSTAIGSVAVAIIILEL